MVEKINALCNAIDTINDLSHSQKRAEAVNELVDMLLAECKNMVETPEIVYGVPPLQAALEQLELLRKIEQCINGSKIKAPVSRPAETEPAFGHKQW
jgi:hypothetical protein